MTKDLKVMAKHLITVQLIKKLCCNNHNYEWLTYQIILIK